MIKRRPGALGLHRSPSTEFKKGNKFSPKKQSEEHKKRISETKKKLFTEGKIISYWKGKLHHHTQESKEKISLKAKERWHNSEYRDRTIKAIFKGLKLSPNNKEKQLNQILQTNFPNEWKFVGDGSMLIGYKSPDFINCNGKKLIIELNGDYWHNLPKIVEKDKRKLEVYNKYGFRTLMIWEHELKYPEQVIEKIRGFMNG